MKKGLILWSLALLSVTTLFAQPKSPAARATSTNIDMRKNIPRIYLTPLPKGLRVDVKITSVQNMVVQETSDPADMVAFRVYEIQVLPNEPNRLIAHKRTEVFGFQVVSRPSRKDDATGNLSYDFSLTGLREGVSYGVDVFPVNNRITATSNYGLGKSGISDELYYYPSTVRGKPILVTFYPFAPPH
jgi:hypothetical protein